MSFQAMQVVPSAVMHRSIFAAKLSENLASFKKNYRINLFGPKQCISSFR
jgi:hypothetical protein